jgi:hypothetical protein
VDHVALRRRESLLARMSISPIDSTHPLHHDPSAVSREELMTDVASHAPALLGNALALTAPTRIRRRLHARKSPAD